MSDTWRRAGVKSDFSNPLAASLSLQTLTGFFFREAENDVDSVFFDIVFSNCGVFLSTLFSKTKKTVFKVRRAQFGSQRRCTATPSWEKK